MTTSRIKNLMVPYTLMVLCLFAGYCRGGFIGLTWGRQSAQRLVPSQVVDLLLQNGIQNLRIFSTQEDILKAFASSNINLTITIFDQLMPNFKDARSWFELKSTLIINAHVRTVIVGGECVFSGKPEMIDFTIKRLREVQAVFYEFGVGQEIKANAIHDSRELNNKTKPSEAEFRDDIKEKMVKFLQFLRENNAPFMLDMYPVQDMERCGLDLAFAFPDSTSIVVEDVNGAVYRDVLEWEYDRFVWALKKLNFSDIDIQVSRIGWPTDGYAGATVANAERFYEYLLPLVASNKGTPMRPGMPIDIFVHALTDEPKMSAVYPYMRHYGIYRSNGQPKYKIDLSGSGRRNHFPVTVKGVMRMPERWCVFKGNNTDMEKVEDQMKLACDEGDCTTLAPGASCSQLSLEQSVSYAFNSYFQTHFQDESACYFQGMAKVVDNDPSTDECVFPVEVVKGVQLLETFGRGSGEAGLCSLRRSGRHGRVVVLLFVVSILWGSI